MARFVSRSLAPVALLSTAVTLWLGLFVTPLDVFQGDLSRLLYIHPALAWVALYVSFGTAAIASGLYLSPRTRSVVVDRIAASAMEIALVFIVLTLVTGSLWGRPAWGVWWVWDARLTSTAVLGVFVVGYLALRRTIDDPAIRASRTAVYTLITAVNVPIVHFSVLWWKTLHQGATVFTPDHALKIHGIMAWTLLLSFFAFTFLFVWLLRWRYRLAEKNFAVDARRLAERLTERQAEVSR
jgi:heme exporter protein C